MPTCVPEGVGEGTRPLPDERDWSAALAGIGVLPETAELLHRSPIDPGRRVYRGGNFVFKVVLSAFQATAGWRRLSLREEFELLKRLGPVWGVPTVVDYQRHGEAEVVIMERAEGVPWTESGISLIKACWTLSRLASLLVRLSLRGVLHGDVKPDNVLIDWSGRPWLVDFDQAQQTSVGASLAGNVLGLEVGGSRVHTSLLGFVRQVLVRSSPPWLLRWVRYLKRRMYRRASRVVLGPLPANASKRLALLHRAWGIGARSDANAPGEGVCYYSLSCDGFHLPGERPWAERWQAFRTAVRFEHQRVLELGCNLGLLSTFARLEGADAVMAVDHDDEILKANALVQVAYGVEYPTRRVDFDSPEPWEHQLSEFRPTVVSALSVLNWIKDKERFLRFLGTFPCVLFEGHDSLLVEAERLRCAGFATVRLVCFSERQRVVLVATKTLP